MSNTLQGTSEVVMGHLSLSGKDLQTIPCPLFRLQPTSLLSVIHLAVHLLLQEMSPSCQGILHLFPVVTSSDMDLVTQKVPKAIDTQLIHLHCAAIKSLPTSQRVGSVSCL